MGESAAWLWRIRDWNEHYEGADSRKRVGSLTWLKLPVNLGGSGYLELVEAKEGPAHFGVWVALLELAATCRSRGTLQRSNGRPHDLASIARATRISEDLIGRALERLVSLGWVELNPAPDMGSENLPVPAATAADSGTREEGEDIQKKKRGASAEAAAVGRVYAAYRAHRPRMPARPSEKNRSLIRARLKDHPEAELLDAIEGNFVDPHCCGQTNGKEYHDLGLILRDSEHVLRYGESLRKHGPGGAANLSQRTRRTQQAAEDYVRRRTGGESSP